MEAAVKVYWPLTHRLPPHRFMLIGCFFCMELFVGVVIDKFNKLRNKAMQERGVSGNQALMTDQQAAASRDNEVLMKLRPFRVRKVVVAPAYLIAENKLFPFDSFILACILINAVTMAAEYVGRASERPPHPLFRPAHPSTRPPAHPHSEGATQDNLTSPPSCSSFTPHSLTRARPLYQVLRHADLVPQHARGHEPCVRRDLHL